VPSLQTAHSMPLPSSPTLCPAYPKAWLTLHPDLALGSTPYTPFYLLIDSPFGVFFWLQWEPEVTSPLSRSFPVLRFWHSLSYRHLHQTWKEQREDEKEMEFKRQGMMLTSPPVIYWGYWAIASGRYLSELCHLGTIWLPLFKC
jgi:hypothetical protein